MCPDLVELSKKSNGTMLLGKAMKDIQGNYKCMWNSMSQYRNYFQKNNQTSRIPDDSSVRTSPEVIAPKDPLSKNYQTIDNFRNLSPIIQQRASIAEEIYRLSTKPSKKMSYTQILMIFCSSLFLISSSSYLLLTKVFHLPSTRTIERFIFKTKAYVGNMQRDISLVPELIDMYKKRESISEQLHAVISVDALFFDKKIFAKADGTIEGIMKPINAQKFEYFINSIDNFEEFVGANWNITINSAFVFYLQPLEAKHKNILLHFHPSTSGKANKEIISTLLKLKESLETKNVSVVAFSADGDSAYAPLINSIHATIHTDITKCMSENCGIDTLFASDILHILKRVRYRFVSRDLYCENNFTSYSMNLAQFKSSMKLSHSTLSDDESTKMKDEYAIAIFQLKNCMILLQNNAYCEGTALLPFSITATAISCENLTFEDRIKLFACAYGFIEGYIEDRKFMPNNLRKDHQKREKPITKQVVRDLQTTIFTIIKLLITSSTPVLLSRISTSPLEHLFSNARRLSKSVHTFSNFASVVSKMKLIDEVQNIVGKFSTKGQRHSYGAMVDNITEFSVELLMKYINDGKAFYNSLNDHSEKFPDDSNPKLLLDVMGAVDSRFILKNYVTSSDVTSISKGKDILGRIFRATQALIQPKKKDTNE